MSDVAGPPRNTSHPGSSECEALWLSDPPDCGRQCDERLAWKRTVALEISVDVGRSPGTVRLSGTLDGETAANLTSLFAELIGEGFLDFELQASALCLPDEDGMNALTDLHCQLRKAGGNLAWDGSTMNHPLPAKDTPFTRAFHRQGHVVGLFEKSGPTK
jgi:hypothetical protein